MITLAKEKKYSLKESPLKNLYQSKVLFDKEKPPIFTCCCVGVKTNETSQSIFIGTNKSYSLIHNLRCK